ncbi:IS3 family transposase [Actinomadura sp. SCN-SB]|uniref:IS3 family transposase n=1 Tax=Actinomadura sp. SCN-SB TaxID=3373092 RepID=UPI0037529752
MLQIARSSLYRWRNAAAARLARRRADEELAARIRRIHAELDGIYGSPRITAELRARVDHKRVERVMRVFGIAGLRLRPAIPRGPPSHRRFVAVSVRWRDVAVGGERGGRARSQTGAGMARPSGNRRRLRSNLTSRSPGGLVLSRWASTPVGTVASCSCRGGCII